MERKEERMGTLTREELLDNIDIEHLALSVQLEELETLLVTFECAAQSCRENPVSEQPEWSLIFRNLRKLQAEIQGDLSGLIDRALRREDVA